MEAHQESPIDNLATVNVLVLPNGHELLLDLSNSNAQLASDIETVFTLSMGEPPGKYFLQLQKGHITIPIVSSIKGCFKMAREILGGQREVYLTLELFTKSE